MKLHALSGQNTDAILLQQKWPGPSNPACPTLVQGGKRATMCSVVLVSHGHGNVQTLTFPMRRYFMNAMPKYAQFGKKSGIHSDF